MKIVSMISLISLIFMSLVGCDSASDSGTGVQNISAEEFQKTVKKEKAQVIDVRTPEEIAEGVIEGTTLFIDYTGSNFEAEIAKLDKSKAYIVYCRSGGRSAAASDLMVEKGFKHIYNLEGGITGWTGNITNP